MDKTRLAYNINAKNYQEKISYNSTYMTHIRDFALRFNPGDRILDMGCGPGINASELSSSGLRVTGIDSSSSMIELARKNCPTGRFIELPVLEFNEEGHYDGIMLSFIIVHLNNDEKTILFDNISRIISDNGFLYLSYMTGKKTGYEKTSFSENVIFFNYYESREIIEELRMFGFTLTYDKRSGYTETNGSVTEDVFQVYQFD